MAKRAGFGEIEQRNKIGNKVTSMFLERSMNLIKLQVE